MSFAELESKIRKSCESQLSKMHLEGKDRLDNISADIKAEAADKSEAISSEGERQIHAEVEGILSQARIDAKDILESVKREVLDDVFVDAGLKITGLSEKEKKKLCDKLYALATDGIDEPKVFVDPSCAKYVKGVGKNLGEFGFIVEDGQGKTRVDARISVLLENIKARMEPELTSILFGK